MTNPTPTDGNGESERDLEDLRSHLERSYQGALESDPHSYTGAARIAFADYVMARFLAWHKSEVQVERLEAAREAQAAKFADYLTSLDAVEVARLLAATLYMYCMEPTNADKVSYKIDGFSRNGKVLGDMKLTANLKAANPPIERTKT